MELVEARATVDDVDGFLERLSAVGDEHGVTVQAFDARYVVDRAHLERAVELADRAIAREATIARDRAVEVLCYAAGRRQINRALEMGVSAGEGPVVVLVDAGPNAGEERTDEGDAEANAAAEREAAETVRSMPELAPAETLGAPDSDLVRERVALLVVER